MFAVPAATPLTTPPVPTVAIPVLVLLHVPDGVPLESIVVVAGQRVSIPVLAAGVVFTVTAFIAVQPEGAV